MTASTPPRSSALRRRARWWRLTRLRRTVLARRRLWGALLAVVAVLAAVRATAEPVEATVPVVVAAGDLPGGTALTADRLELRDLPVDALPEGAADATEQVAGRVLAAPLRRGEPVTDVRLVGPGLLDGYPGLVAAPVRLADPAVTGLLEVGDRVDLVAADPSRGEAEVVAAQAPVVAVPDEAGGASEGTPSSRGGLLLVAVDREAALVIADTSATAVMSVLLTSGRPS